MQHQAIIFRRLVKVCAFATSEDAADAAVSRTAKHVVVVMDAATQAAVATNVVRVLGMNQPNHNDDLALRCCGFNRILLILLKRGCQMK